MDIDAVRIYRFIIETYSVRVVLSPRRLSIENTETLVVYMYIFKKKKTK